MVAMIAASPNGPNQPLSKTATTATRKDRHPGLLRQFPGRKIGSRRREHRVDQRVELDYQRG